ncbi:MAG: nuclease-related domain-containing protein [Erysipelotrichia bacterium]|nr:nuclease-related domain-containing protein [Erysipelotrichia bacterium]
MILLIIFIAAIIILVIAFSKENRSVTSLTDEKGLYGEEICVYYLRKMLRKDEYILNNLLLSLRNGRKTEIDAVIVSQKGIFCIEIKNWVGHISGDNYSQYWYQRYDDKYLEDKLHRNPFIQNENHCKVLARLFNYKYSVNNVILFPKIEDKQELHSSTTFELEEFIKYYRCLSNGKLHSYDVEKVVSKLRKYEATDEQLKNYKKQMQREKNEHD